MFRTHVAEIRGTFRTYVAETRSGELVDIITEQGRFGYRDQKGKVHWFPPETRERSVFRYYAEQCDDPIVRVDPPISEYTVSIVAQHIAIWQDREYTLTGGDSGSTYRVTRDAAGNYVVDGMRFETKAKMTAHFSDSSSLLLER